MAELLKPVPEQDMSPQEWLDYRLALLAADMRCYDELIATYQHLKEARNESYEIMGELDIDEEIELEDQPIHLAYQALGMIVLDKRLAKVNEELLKTVYYSDLRWHEAYERFGNSTVRIEALDDNSIHVLQISGVVSRQPLRTAEGRLNEIGFRAQLGGNIDLKGRFGRTYQARPLIDRDKDYQPTFSIQVFDKK